MSANTQKSRVSAVPRALTEAALREMPASAYMNERQLAFFRERLKSLREEVLSRERDIRQRLSVYEPPADPMDRASLEEQRQLDLRLREREGILLRKIDQALRRIQRGEYGYCETTGEPIGIPRLLARPTASVCADVKDYNEQMETRYRDMR